MEHLARKVLSVPSTSPSKAKQLCAPTTVKPKAGKTTRATKSAGDRFLNLPHEIQDLILSHIASFPRSKECITCRYRTLSAMSKVSWGWYRVMGKYLYGVVWISQIDPDTWNKDRFLRGRWGTGEPRKFGLNEEWRISRLVRTLEERKDLAEMVRVLKLPGFVENALALLLWARVVKVCRNVQYVSFLISGTIFSIAYVKFNDPRQVYGPEFTHFHIFWKFPELLNCLEHAHLRYLTAISACTDLREFSFNQELTRISPAVFHNTYAAWTHLEELTISLNVKFLVHSFPIRPEDLLKMFMKLRQSLTRLMLENVPYGLLDDRIFLTLNRLVRLGVMNCPGISLEGLKGFLESGYDAANALKMLVLEEMDLTAPSIEDALAELCDVVSLATSLSVLKYRTGRKVMSLPQNVALLKSPSLQHIDFRFTPWKIEDHREYDLELEMSSCLDYQYMYRSVAAGHLPSLKSVIAPNIRFLSEQITDEDGNVYLCPEVVNELEGGSYILSVQTPFYCSFADVEIPGRLAKHSAAVHVHRTIYRLRGSGVVLMRWQKPPFTDFCDGTGKIGEGMPEMFWWTVKRERKKWARRFVEWGERSLNVLRKRFPEEQMHPIRYSDERLPDLLADWGTLEVQEAGGGKDLEAPLFFFVS
ncbi:hypothetical protein RUND412_002937 [Rhizina undulata]